MKLTLIVTAAIGVIGALTVMILTVPMDDNYPTAYRRSCL